MKPAKEALKWALHNGFVEVRRQPNRVILLRAPDGRTTVVLNDGTGRSTKIDMPTFAVLRRFGYKGSK